MNHKRGRPKGSRAGCTMCKPWKHQSMKGGTSPETLGARNFRLTQDKISNLLGEESRTQIAREVEALSCNDPGCDCRLGPEAYEDALLEAVTGELAKKLAELNITVTWAA